MDPFIGLLIIVLVSKAAVDKGRREYRATREQHAAQIARAHPDWHPRKVSRSAGRRAMSHWWNELAAWPPFPSMRATFAEERMTAKVATAEARAAGVERWKELRERLERALNAQREHEGGDAAPAPHPLPSETVGGAGQPLLVRPRDEPLRPGMHEPYRDPADPAPDDLAEPDGQPRDSSWLEPHEERCEGCGGTGANADGTDACPVCRGWGSRPPDPDAPPWWHGEVCRACGRPGTAEDPVVSTSQIHRSHAVEAQALYQEALARQRGDAPAASSDPFPEPEPDNWPTGVPHRRNGDAPSPATNGGSTVTSTDIDTALENADTPHEAMQGAFRQIGDRAAEFAQAASDELAAAAAVHGMDRDPQTMSDIAALADHAQALQAQANQAATGLGQRHAEGAEYHSTGTDAHASAYRPS